MAGFNRLGFILFLKEIAMANRHRLFRRRGGTYYLHDALTRKQKSLSTKSRKEALRVLHAQREAEQVPNIARQIARAYLHTADPEAATRTWRTVADRIVATKSGSTLVRWKTALKDPALRHLWDMLVAETWADSFLEALEMGTVSTNVYLRRLHNYAVDMQWVVQPIVPKRQWPTVRFREKRAITIDEHRLILEREKNVERKRFYDLAWHLGASQSDLAHLDAADVDRENRTITFVRLKLRHRSVNPPKIRFGSDVEDLLNQLPQTGPLFPYLIGVREADRATEFRQRCRGLGIEGVTLHSYRYSWAERAKSCGFPERFAQAALGHNSQAVHRAYSRKADVTIPALEDYEREALTKVIAFQTKSSDKAA
jgi:hypothetical protein